MGGWVVRLVGVAVGIATILSGTAASQTAIGLDKCISWGPTGWPDCGRIPGEIFDTCSNTTFGRFWGRYAWYPLEYVAPITIELETRGALSLNLPLYVEIVPLPDSVLSEFCLSGYSQHQGYLVGVVGGSQVCGGAWETFGPIDLREIVSIGGKYALQLQGFGLDDYGHPFSSPGVDCIRVTASQATTTRVSWAQVKALFK